MTVNTMLEVVCDGCGEAEQEWNTRPAALRARLRTEEGWTCTRSGDFCPRCTPKDARA